MKFSQRQGIVGLPKQMAPDAMTPELRVSFWNVLCIFVWNSDDFADGYNSSGRWRGVAQSLWISFFKKSFSTIPPRVDRFLELLEKFVTNAEWHEVYDFLEAVMDMERRERNDGQLEGGLNAVLTAELAAYRILSSQFIPITTQEEVDLLNRETVDSSFAAVSGHLRSALSLLSDRTAPDYRNSIKESISAVEAMSRIVSENPKATLGEALNTLEKTGRLHKALKSGFSAIYGYTNDADGIRHAMMDEPSLSIEDAKFFLLSCASFTSYLKSKLPS